jgi:transcriptional regulator with XRE-family HTH domain
MKKSSRYLKYLLVLIKIIYIFLRAKYPKMEQAIENIKKFRELKNLTREQLAERLEMSLSGYSKIERGEVDLTLSKLYKIADVLEVSVSQILSFDASQIFNVSNNNTINGLIISENNVYNDGYKEKYIKLLESEIERLKSNLTMNKID